MTPGRWCLLVVIAVVVVAWSVWPEHSTDNPQYDALSKALTRARTTRDSVRTVASEARKENVVQRRKYTEARAILPPAFVKMLEDSATIHITTETFTIPKPVAVYIVSLQSALDKADSALVAADSALAKTQAEVAAADTVSASAEKVIEVLQEKPGFLSRIWQRIETPAKIGGGFLLGALAAKVTR